MLKQVLLISMALGAGFLLGSLGNIFTAISASLGIGLAYYFWTKPSDTSRDKKVTPTNAYRVDSQSCALEGHPGFNKRVHDCCPNCGTKIT